MYDRLYALYKDVYFALGQRHAAALPLGRVLPGLREIAAEARLASLDDHSCWVTRPMTFVYTSRQRDWSYACLYGGLP